MSPKLRAGSFWYLWWFFSIFSFPDHVIFRFRCVVARRFENKKYSFIIHRNEITYYGHPKGVFFSKIPNFWAWADKLGWLILGYLGYFRLNYQHCFVTVSPLVVFPIKNFYQVPNMILGIMNLGNSLHTSAIINSVCGILIENGPQRY